MSDEINDQQSDGQGAPPGADDPVKNLKSEFNRKIENLNDQISRQNQEILAMLQKPSQQAAPIPEANLQELMYSDPKAFAEAIAARADARADEKISKVLSQQAESQQAIGTVVAQYPEFADQNHEVTKRAIELSKQQPRGLAGTAAGNKMAMLEAATEYGLVPASRRKASSTDDFALSGGSSGGNGNRQRTSRNKETELTPETMDWAELLTPGISKDPKRVDGLKSAAQRKRWNQYK